MEGRRSKLFLQPYFHQWQCTKVFHVRFLLKFETFNLLLENRLTLPQGTIPTAYDMPYPTTRYQTNDISYHGIWYGLPYHKVPYQRHIISRHISRHISQGTIEKTYHITAYDMSLLWYLVKHMRLLTNFHFFIVPWSRQRRMCKEF